jgi:chemosensory pili system protein ChpA (sensor histidine kinase/response regulator)
MDLLNDTETIEDLSALAWVHDELRLSLETAHKALRRYLKEADAMAGSDVDAVDPSVLRTARAQLHQSVGALELVGMPTAAQVLRASEAALQKLSASRPIKLGAKHVETIEQASFALLDYLSRLLASKPVSPLALFPQYREVQELAGADRVHPADLWPHDWQWREVAGNGAQPRVLDAALRSEVETLTLGLMRQGSGEPALALSSVFAGLAAGSDKKRRHMGTLWHLAAAFFEAQGQRLLVPDIYSKRIASRLLAQLRMSEHVDDSSARPNAGADVSQRLAQDLLFYCAQASSPGDGRSAPRLAAVRQAWNLGRRAPVDYLVTTLGRHDPAAIVQAKKRVHAAKESWAAVAGSELHRLSSLNEQFALVGESLRKLYPAGDHLGNALSAAAAQVVHSGAVPAPMLAMEVATAVLFLEASLDDGDFDHPAQAERVQRLAARIQKVSHGGRPEPLDVWMEVLYRRVSDRQTMGSVVQELKGSLAEAEKAIDLYFRETAQVELLHPVPGQLNSMRGVFSVLGLDQASQAVVRMRDDVDALVVAAKNAVTPDAAITERLTTNLGALGFLIDMLNVQPAMAKALFAFDAAAGQLRAVMATHGRTRIVASAGGEQKPMAQAPVEPRLIEQAQSLGQAAAHLDVPLVEVRHELDRLSQEAMVADQPVLAETMQQVKSAFEVAINDDERRAVREELAQAMTDFVHSTAAAKLDEVPAPSRPLPLLPTAPTPAGQTGLEDDAEMREIFLEEAREVIVNANAALAALADDGSDVSEMTTVRRAFHTLKGSARMVGLTAFGEAGWDCEQLYNARLAEQQSADAPLLTLTTDILAYMADWVDAIGAGRAAGHSPGDVSAAIQRWRASGDHGQLGAPSAASTAAKRSTDLDSISRPMALDGLLPDELAENAGLAPAAAANVQPLDQLLTPETEGSFELDLGEAARLEVGGRDALQSLASPEREADAPSPEVVSAMMSLEFLATNNEPTIDDVAASTPADAASAAGPMTLEPPSQPEPLVEEPAYRMIGTLRVGVPLFNIFLNEADEQSRRLGVELAEWSHEFAQRPVGDDAIALAHSLAGNSATVGFTDLSHLARLLEHALMRSQTIGEGDAQDSQLFNDSADEIRGLLHQFAAGFLKAPTPALIDRLVDHERIAAERVHAMAERAPSAETAEAPAPMFEAPVDEAPVDEAPADEAPADEASADEAVDPDQAQDVRVAEPVAEADAAPVEFEPPVVEPPVVEAAAFEPPLETLGQAEFHTLAPLDMASVAVERRSVARPKSFDGNDDIDAVDVVDVELFPIFQEEAAELLPQLASRMRDWLQQPSSPSAPSACMRTLHTLKGGARLAGAMRLGELAHRLETLIEHLMARQVVNTGDVEGLFTQVDALGNTFERLVAGPLAVDLDLTMPETVVPHEPLPMRPMPVIAARQAPQIQPEPEPETAVAAQHDVPAPADAPRVEPPAQPQVAAAQAVAAIDWGRFAASGEPTAAAAAFVPRPAAAALSTVRVRAPLLDRLVNHAGEVMIARSRIESEVGSMKGSLGDLTENLERLRSQLRDIELQAESQISSRMEAAKAEGASFDPLEMDRFTRFQELTRMMAESVNDVATVQRSLTRTLQLTEDDLAAQARLARDLQDDLLRTRMVEFESLSDRLYRVARQAAKETHKQVRLDIVGGSIEVDRGVLERMGGAFEHLLRNCVTHGIEMPDERERQGKDPAGQITVSVHHEGNEVSVDFRDDGAGLNLQRIRERGVAAGLVATDAQPSDAELANLIFTPGFSTADSVTELAGRGVGMDVVRNDVNALGGRIETSSAAGQGTNFKLVLPLTTAVTQVVMLRAGASTVAVPATLIDIVRRVPAAEVAAATRRGSFEHGDKSVPFFWFGALLQGSGRSDEVPGRTLTVVIIKSAAQRVALHVDEVIGNQEVVVKNLGHQLARLPGLAGVTLLASGAPALIYNPVALATLYGASARAAMQRAFEVPEAAPAVTSLASSARTPQAPAAAPTPKQAPLVLVVDDSLTVRRVTQRLLTREGYRVTTAKDGLDGLEKLADETPVVVLSDIEMPRMDGFDLVRNLRADTRWAGLPVIMITSRIAEKHREHAAKLGVNHYLGKPYSEDDLLGLVAQYAGQVAMAD